MIKMEEFIFWNKFCSEKKRKISELQFEQKIISDKHLPGIDVLECKCCEKNKFEDISMVQ